MFAPTKRAKGFRRPSTANLASTLPKTKRKRTILASDLNSSENQPSHISHISRPEPSGSKTHCLHPNAPFIASLDEDGSLSMYDYEEEIFRSVGLNKVDVDSEGRTLSALAFSTTGSLLALGEVGPRPRILVWDYNREAMVAELEGHYYGVMHLAFSPNSQRLVSIGTDVNAISFSLDGKYFVTAGDSGHFQFWNVDVLAAYPKTKISRVGGTVETVAALEGKDAQMFDESDSNFVDVVCAPNSAESQALGGSVFSFTDKGVLGWVLEKGRRLEKYVDIKVSTGKSLASTDSFVMCGCSDGIIRIFTHDLQFVKTVISSETVSPSATPYLFDVMSVRLGQSKLIATYGDGNLRAWDCSDVQNPLELKTQILASLPKNGSSPFIRTLSQRPRPPKWARVTALDHHGVRSPPQTCPGPWSQRIAPAGIRLFSESDHVLVGPGSRKRFSSLCEFLEADDLSESLNECAISTNDSWHPTASVDEQPTEDSSAGRDSLDSMVEGVFKSPVEQLPTLDMTAPPNLEIRSIPSISEVHEVEPKLEVGDHMAVDDARVVDAPKKASRKQPPKITAEHTKRILRSGKTIVTDEGKSLVADASGDGGLDKENQLPPMNVDHPKQEHGEASLKEGDVGVLEPSKATSNVGNLKRGSRSKALTAKAAEQRKDTTAKEIERMRQKVQGMESIWNSVRQSDEAEGEVMIHRDAMEVLASKTAEKIIGIMKGDSSSTGEAFDHSNSSLQMLSVFTDLLLDQIKQRVA
ncbi:WD40-repeat-containing domain protein [Cladochytrium replicatum]|nr:WD40-repeat-containing domain protein [Cladochytrium replicatum]